MNCNLKLTLVRRVVTSDQMNGPTVTKILNKRVTTDGSDQYLVQYKTNKETTDKWVSSEELTNYQHLIDEFDRRRDRLKGKTDRTSVQVNGNDSTADSEPKNGFEKGFRPYKILGAKSNDNNQLMFLVMFREDLTKAELIPNHVLHEKCPQLLIKFYEKNTLWKRS